MKWPQSTYRIQLSSGFTFEHLQEVVEYLENLGVSTIYASPLFQAREGSTHGYDVTDPFSINKEIGRLETFRNISRSLQQKKMGWLQDIVPNHMAFDGSNPWLRDIFELGSDSRFYNFFDVDWDYKGWKKLMAPFLGNPLDEVIKNGELQIKLDQNGFSINYYDHSYPASAPSYAEILSGFEAEGFTNRFKGFSGNNHEWQDLKAAFYREVEDNPELNNQVSSLLKDINQSGERIHQILDHQYFKPTYWKETEKEINYRRFFTINDLICLRMEDPNVFDTYHYFIKELCDAGMIDGLRIDHIDGLFDPQTYTQRLKKLVGDDFYVVVEKILEKEEKLPQDWPVEGTSGYDFLAEINHLFTQTNNEAAFTEAYQKINSELPAYEELVYQKKLFILKERMGGELQNLWQLIKEKDLLPGEEQGNDENWKDALSSFLAAFPVYRTYPMKFPLKQSEKELIETAYNKALQHSAVKEELDYLKKLFLGEAEADKEKMLYFLQRCQQFSGPLAAKGVEDTSFYIYNRLISHNEVGDSPEDFGISVEGFHQKMLQKQSEFPQSLNATATHDTKRGEDARMRINVLSELPQEWFQKVEEWQQMNQQIREKKNSPDANEEYFIYQALIGAMPFDDFEEAEFLQRTKDYVQKAMREAKVNSNWAIPDEEHENAVFNFTENILKNNKFRASFDPFCRKISRYGAIKSLGQTLVKITVPGIPDIYQGTELWDLSYVDPDNRRPVDYELRENYLAEFKAFEDQNIQSELQHLMQNFSNGKIKMYSLHKTLAERKKYPEVFEKGEYIPLSISGNSSEKIIAFARRQGKKCFVSIAPVLVTELLSKDELLPDAKLLEGNYVSLPEDFPGEWKNIFTNETFKSQGKIDLMELFSSFPIAFLTNID